MGKNERDAREATQRIESLRQGIRRHDHLYFVLSTPEISDEQYDGLMRDLRQLEAQHPDLVTPDSPSQRVGERPLEGFTHVRHAVPMLSIDNTYSPEELREFDARVRKGLAGEPYSYVVDPKIDGVAVSLRYEDGLFVQGATRGDGETGDDVTQNLRAIRSVPLRLIGQDWPRVLEVRGEVYWPRPAFDETNRQRNDAGETPFANPRNATAGTLKQLDSRIVATRALAFLAHGVGEIDPMPGNVATHSALFARLRDWGVPTSPHARQCAEIEQVIAFVAEWDERRRSLDYDTDGLVVKIERLDQRRRLGTTSKSPRWCMAYKYAAEQAQTRLLSVDFQVGKLGTITPVANLEPVQLAGTTVKRATLHNFDQVRRLDLYVGDVVTVEKAGEIIPQVVAVDASQRPPHAKPVRPPTSCPECDGKVVQDEGGVYLRCINPACPAQLVERLRFFCARDQMDIEGGGIKLVETLVQQEFVHTYADLYRLHERRDEIASLSFETTFGPANAEKLLAAIEAHRVQQTEQVLARLNFPFLGEAEARAVAVSFPTIEALTQATLSQLKATAGTARRVAEELHTYFNPPDPSQLVENLQDAQKRLGKRGRLEAIGVAGLGEGRIDRFVKNGLIQRYADLFTLHLKREKLAAVQFETTFGEKNTDALLESISQSKSRPLSRVLAALGIRHVGTETADVLAGHFASIDALMKADEPEIRRALSGKEDEGARRMAEGIHAYFRSDIAKCALEQPPVNLTFAQQVARLDIPVLRNERTREKRIPQFEKAFDNVRELAEAPVERIQHALEDEKRVARSVHEFFHGGGGERIVKDLAEVGVKMTQPAPDRKRGDGPLTGQTVVVTGTLEHFSRTEIDAWIKSLGGKPASSVSGKTNLVLCGDSPGSKLEKARELGVEVVGEPEFIKRFGRP